MEDEDIVCAHSDMWIRDERTEMNEPLVCRLWYQLKRRVAMFGRDKRWKHLSAKPLPRLDTMNSWKTTRLIGSRCKARKGFSRGVLICSPLHNLFVKHLNFYLKKLSCADSVFQKGVFVCRCSTGTCPTSSHSEQRSESVSAWWYLGLPGESRVCRHTKAPFLF